MYYTIPNVSFINQKWAGSRQLIVSIIVSVFRIFSLLPAHLPALVMQKQVKRVYDFYLNEPDIKIISYTVDPYVDTPDSLFSYSNGLNVKSSKWSFLTGDADKIYSMAQHYLIKAGKDDDAEGGYFHSNSAILIDRSKRIRGYYNSTDKKRLIT